jgi:ribosomal protein L7/L12
MNTPVFDTANMMVLLSTQQGTEQFRQGQRIDASVAELLNGLPKVIAAIKAYQDEAGHGASEATEFVKVVTPAVDESVAPATADEARHTPSAETVGRLMNGVEINTSTGEKHKIIT